MVEIKKANHNYQWSKSDRKTLKAMVKEGKSNKEIAEVLGRTPGAVMYQKSVMGLVAKKVKVSKAPKVKSKSGKTVEMVPESPRDKAKEMASVARGIARSNGKRITMAMFFIEDL